MTKTIEQPFCEWSTDDMGAYIKKILDKSKSIQEVKNQLLKRGFSGGSAVSLIGFHVFEVITRCPNGELITINNRKK